MPNIISEIKMRHLAALEHQRAIKQLIIGLDKLYKDGKTNLEALPETDIDPGNPDSKCPDVILRNNDEFAVPVIIEVTTNMGYRNDYNKVCKLINETDFGITEGFVLNFESGDWYKYSKEHGVVLEETSWSAELQFDLKKSFQTVAV